MTFIQATRGIGHICAFIIIVTVLHLFITFLVILTEGCPSLLCHRRRLLSLQEFCCYDEHLLQMLLAETEGS